MLLAKKDKAAGNVEELKQTREHIKNLLASLETEYNNAAVSDTSYKEIKEKNLKKLKEVEDKIRELGGKIDEPKPVINNHLDTPNGNDKPKPEVTEKDLANSIKNDTEVKPEKSEDFTVGNKSVVIDDPSNENPGEKTDDPPEDNPGEEPDSGGKKKKKKKPREGTLGASLTGVPGYEGFSEDAGEEKSSEQPAEEQPA